MAKLHLDRLRDRYPGSVSGENYRNLMTEILANGHENTQRAVARIKRDEMGKAAARIQRSTSKQVALPSLEEVLPKRSVYIRKGAEQGQILSDSLRDKLTANLRESVAEFLKTGAGSMQYRRGEARGRMNPELSAKLRDRLTETFRDYKSPDATGIPPNVSSIAETEIRSAVDDIKHTWNTRLAESNPGRIEIIKIWRHHPSLSKEPRGNHSLMDGVEKPLNVPFIVPRWLWVRGRGLSAVGVTVMKHPHDPSAPVDQVVSCIPGDSYVFSNDTEALMRSWYVGKMVSVRTEKGLEFSTTSNHPILTDHGWIKAESLIVGGNIVCVDFGKVFDLRNKNIKNRPSVIREIFDFPLVGGMRSFHGITRANGQFHGEGEKRKVDIKTINRVLWNNFKAPSFKHLPEFIFTLALLKLSKLCGYYRLSHNFIRDSATTNRIMGILGYAHSIIFGHRLHAENHAFPASSSLNSISSENAHDDISSRSVFAGDDRFRHPGEIVRNDNLFINGKPGTIFDMDPINPGSNEHFSDSHGGDAIFDCKGSFGHEGTIITDKIVDIDVIDFSGHVYNLQTKSDVYAITANKIISHAVITHNCKCEVDYITRIL